MTKCGSNSHGTGRLRPESVATLTRIKGAKLHVGEVRERCFDHLVNILTYWEGYWAIAPRDAEEVAEAEAKAARARQGKR